MYTKFDRKYKAKALSNDATASLELPEAGVLSAIKLDFGVANANAVQNANKARIIDHITNIEVTDGGTDVMFSLRGQAARALDHYHLGTIPPESAILYGNKTQRTTVIIPFGESIGDPSRALDLAAWDQVDLEITNDADTDNWADKALNVDVQLLTLNDLGIVPSTYYKHYEWRATKPAADAQYLYHQLPTTDKIRRYMVQLDPDLETTGEATHDPVTDSNNIKFTFKENTETALEGRPKDIMRYNSAVYGRVETFGRYFQSTSQSMDLGIGYITNTPFGECGDTAGGTITDIGTTEDGNGRFQVLRDITAGATANELVDLHAIGEGYYHTMVLFDSFSRDEAKFLDPGKAAAAKGPVRLETYNVYDDHTIRSMLTVAKPQGVA